MTRRRLLVVDWDYFCPAVETTYDTPGSDRGQWEWMLYDWGHSETVHAEYFRTAAWLRRAYAFVQNGLPLPDTSGEELTFWKRFRFAKDARLYVAESNSQAAHPLVQAGVNAIYLYDAHHDSGYRATALQDVAERQSVNCEDWMLAYYGWGVRKLAVRYPRWRTVALDCEPEPAIPVDRQFDDGQPVPLTFNSVFVCRSGAWTPPWLDPKFIAFVDACPVQPGQQLDDMKERPWTQAMLDAEVAQQEQVNAMLQQQLDQPGVRDAAIKVLGEIELSG